MKDKKTIIISTLCCLLPIIYGVMVYDKLPEMVATHWGANNEPNGYSHRAIAAFGIPVFMAVLNVIVNMITRSDPKRQNAPKVLRGVMYWLLPAMTVILYPMTLLYAQGVEFDFGFVCTMILGVLFTAIGNYLPKCKHNFTMGIKLPWTLASEDNWNKTHRMAGYLWIIGGIVIIVSSFIGSYMMLLPVVLLMVLIPAIYSYVTFKKDSRN